MSDDMLGMLGGRRADVIAPFIFGTISAEVECLFEVERTGMAKSVAASFWVHGDMGYPVETPFYIGGALSLAIQTPFMVLDGTDGVFDEGGLTKPLIGWFDNWEG